MHITTKFYLLLALFFVNSHLEWSSSGILFAQQTPTIPKAEQQQPGAPADLPDIIIKGSATLNLLDKTLAKQSPRNTPRILQRDLDSLNTLEKQSPLLLSVVEYPRSLITHSRNKGYARAEFGIFTSPEIELGYGDTYAGYTLYGRGYFNNSSGHLDNAGFTRAGADITARYIAPDKYILFGGSQTTTALSLAHNDYSLFASTNSLARNHTRFSGSVDVQGESAGIPFTAGFSAQTLQFTQLRSVGSRELSESGIQGYFSLQSKWNDFSVGIKGTTDLRNYDSRAVNFHQVYGTAAYIDSIHTFSLRVGIQAAHASNDITHGAVLLNPQYTFNASPSVKIHSELFSGLENSSFTEFLRANPYTSDSSVISFARTSFRGSVGLTYQPTTAFTSRFDISYRSMSNAPVFVADSGFSFNPSYIEMNMLMSALDVRYQLSSTDILSANLCYTSALTNGNKVPYIAPLNIGVRYDKSILTSIILSGIVDYVAARSVRFVSQEEIPSYFNVSLRAEYVLSRSFSTYLRFDNILNSSIFVWEGYRERGAFAAGGIRWMFD